jgi:mannose-1-phosphate guanylyltransferase
MAGGIGSRFWPMSKNANPKQFLDILGTGRTLLQGTYDRFLKICPKENIYISTSDMYIDLVKAQLPDITDNQIIPEPVRRNTAPSVAYASYKINKINPDANIVVAPSDHIILKEEAFVDAINQCFALTEKEDCLVTLGVTPSRPDTGYGYIQFNEDTYNGSRLRKVKTFTEKPDLEMAKFFLQSGEFVWNAGIFVWSAKSILKAIAEHLPDINAIFKDGISIYGTPKEQDFIKKAYTQCTNISIDYGIMEKAKNVYVLPSEFGWSDLGTWGSLYEHSDKDKNENAVNGNVMLYDSKNCIVNISKGKLAVIQGLEDYIISESDGIILICKKEEEQQIKQFVNDVKINKGEKFV